MLHKKRYLHDIFILNSRILQDIIDRQKIIIAMVSLIYWTNNNLPHMICYKSIVKTL